jgi:hypothetical protein
MVGKRREEGMFSMTKVSRVRDGGWVGEKGGGLESLAECLPVRKTSQKNVRPLEKKSHRLSSKLGLLF